MCGRTTERDRYINRNKRNFVSAQGGGDDTRIHENAPGGRSTKVMRELRRSHDGAVAPTLSVAVVCWMRSGADDSGGRSKKEVKGERGLFKYVGLTALAS